MCQDSKSFTTLHQLENPINVVLGDGRALTAIGRGEVVLDMVLSNGESKSCTLHDVLYVPMLGKIVKFTESACYMLTKGIRWLPGLVREKVSISSTISLITNELVS